MTIQQPVAVQRCPHCLGPIMSDTPIIRASLAEHGIRIVAGWFQLPSEDVRSRSQRRHLTKARQVLWAALRRVDDRLSYPDIGGMFDGRDHTTIHYGVRKAETEWPRDVHAIAEQLREVNRALHAEPAHAATLVAPSQET